MSPTVGGQHHWVSEFAPQSWRRPLSYTAGWLACIGWQSICATDCYIISEVIQALITINNPDYLPTRWAATLLTILTSMVLSAFITFAAQHLRVSEGVFMTCHVFAFVPIFVTLWVMVDLKTSVTEAFVHIRDNGGGWPTPSLSVLVGQIACVYATSGCDSVIHLADEIENAALTVPKGMVWALILNFPMALIMLVTYCVNIGPMGNALGGRYPPFVAVVENALHSRGAVTAFTVVTLALLVMITISALAATSRQTFAFARDKGLPFSQHLSHVSGSCQVPVNAVFATACTTALLALIQLGNKTSMNITLALACAALMAASTLSIGTLVLRRLRKQRLPHARWSLGRSGMAINCCALAYTSWAFFWSLWPSHYHTTAANFNWAPIILLAVMACATVLYQIDGRRGYEAPVITEVESVAE